MSKLDKDALANAAQAMCDHGIEIRSPDDGDLDDLETERYDALRAAILAYLTTPALSSSPAAEPVAWRMPKSDTEHLVTSSRLVAQGWESFHAPVEPLFAAPVELDALRREIASYQRVAEASAKVMQDQLNEQARLRSDLTRVTAERDEAVATLRLAEAAMSEFYRYWHGGETRGSYDGRPERDALFRAMHAAHTTLSRLSRKDTDNE